MTETNAVRPGSIEFFTIVARNYLAYAFVLGESVLKYHPDATFSIFLMDDVDHGLKSSIEARGFKTIYPEEIPLADYRKFVFQYNITEASTGVKPSVVQALFDGGAEKVIYLDPDILCFRRFDEVLSALNEYCIVLTPHICQPESRNAYPGDRGLLSTGVFNLGFLALRGGEDSKKFVKWWSEHLKRECVQEPDAGLYVDQKWIDLVPACFDNVLILRSRAYNIAYWNLHERTLEERAGVLLEGNSGERVAFIHFSGFAVEDPNSICKYSARNPFNELARRKRSTLDMRPDLASTFGLYKRLLLEAKIDVFARVTYAYANYDNGEAISQLERSLFLSSDEWFSSTADPFQAGQGSFQSACRKAGVRASIDGAGNSSAEEITKRYALYMRLIEFLLRLCVRVLGPQRYLDFAKYMRHQFLPLDHGFLLSRKAAERPSSSPRVAGERHCSERAYKIPEG
jgi:hypothetical protein